MCHGGDLSMTWQLSYPRHHSAGAAGGNEGGGWHARIQLQRLRMGDNESLRQASPIQYVQVVTLA